MKTAAVSTIELDVELLDEVMVYSNRGLAQRLQEKMEISHQEARALFDDMKRFLYLAATTPTPLAPPELIDEAWHNFILFTKDYADFCRKYFGKFIHHFPVLPEERASRNGSIIKNTYEAAKRAFGDDLSANWISAGGMRCCEKCAPSTNCQDK